jgi:hypothetical protein
VLLPRMTDQELEDVFIRISRLLKRHLDHGEYHRLFLKTSTESREAESC